MNVKISELKARLSSFIHQVRKGKILTVMDRKTPVATISPLAARQDELLLNPASRPLRGIAGAGGVHLLKPADSLSMLRQTREDG